MKSKKKSVKQEKKQRNLKEVIVLYFYSVFLVMLGSYAYLHAASAISLITSLSCALIITTAATIRSQSPLGFGVTGLLALYFSLNYISSHRFFPHGLIALVSLFVVLWPLLSKVRFSIVHSPRSTRRIRR